VLFTGIGGMKAYNLGIYAAYSHNVLHEWAEFIKLKDELENPSLRTKLFGRISALIPTGCDDATASAILGPNYKLDSSSSSLRVYKHKQTKKFIGLEMTFGKCFWLGPPTP